MRVKVDNPWRHGETVNTEHVIGISINPANGLDAAIVDRDISEKRWHARAVVNAPAFEY
jgi:hypothetical protein